MILDDIGKNFFDSWGEPRFRNWMFEVMKQVYGNQYFIPGPAKGRDGGVDSKYLIPDELPFKHQIKWRAISGSDGSKLRSEIFTTFKKEIEKKASEGQVMKYLFITNVHLTQKYRDKFEKIVESYPNLNIEYWEFEAVSSYLRQYEDLYTKYNPYFTKEEIEKMRQEQKKKQDQLEKMEKKYSKKVSEAEFRNIQSKIKDLFINKKLQCKFYHGFIYFLKPFFLGRKGEEERKILRQLLDITKSDENYFIKELKKTNQIILTGELVTVNDEDAARQILNEVLDNIQIPLEKIINLFTRKT